MFLFGTALASHIFALFVRRCSLEKKKKKHNHQATPATDNKNVQNEYERNLTQHAQLIVSYMYR